MVPQLHTVEAGSGGIVRKKYRGGFRYFWAGGPRIDSDVELARVTGLVIPPAWSHVWIAADPRAHLQATGVDAAGRTQYIYHPLWRDLRDQAKFARAAEFAQHLPALRGSVTRDLKQSRDARLRAVAAAVRLMDGAGLRVGGAVYAEENGSFGATTLQRRHVSAVGTEVHLSFRGKSGGPWDVLLSDNLLGEYFAALPHRPRNGPAICYASMCGRRKLWHPITDTEVNSYLGRKVGADFTAKDFRTWQGTTVAALSMARSKRAGSSAADAVSEAAKAAAEWLHNTPAIAKESYIDPRVFMQFERGKCAALDRQHDRAVLALLAE